MRRSLWVETSLPAAEHFYNRLTDTAVDEGYAHAQKVWATFKMRTLGDYHDLYLKTDVLLLADVFENFCNMSLQVLTRSILVTFTLLQTGLGHYAEDEIVE